MAFLKSMNDQEYKTARTYAAGNLSFVGVLGTRDGKEAYFKDMEQMQAKNDIKKVFVDDNDVCVIFDISFGNSPNMFTCGWYHIEGRKISSTRMIFDLRPLLQQK